MLTFRFDPIRFARACRHKAGLFIAASAILLSACSGDSPSEPITSTPVQPPRNDPSTPPPTPANGSLRVTTNGLPAGATPVITVSGTGINRTLPANGRIDALAPGDYLVVAEPTTVSNVVWNPAPSSQSVTIRAGEETRAPLISYSASGASLAIVGTGLPSYARGTVRVHAVDGGIRTALTRDTVWGLSAGTYVVSTGDVETTDGRFAARPVSQTVVLTENEKGSVTIAYALAVATLEIGVNGLPRNAPAGIHIRGPGGFSHLADSSQSISLVETGLYTATTGAVKFGGFTWTPERNTQDVMFTGLQHRKLDFNYALTTGAIAVSVHGLPENLDADINISGPNGFSQRVSATETITDLEPGSYLLIANDISGNRVDWSATPESLHVDVSASLSASAAVVNYKGHFATLVVNVDGIPSGGSVPVTVSGPFNYSADVSSSDTLKELVPGRYVINASSAMLGGTQFVPMIAEQTVDIAANETATRNVQYVDGSIASLAITISGLPNGANAELTVNGPGGFSEVLTNSSMLYDIPPGTWTISAARVTHKGYSYEALSPETNLNIAGGTQRTAEIVYSAVSGILHIETTGLPANAAAALQVEGPSSYSNTLSATSTLEDLKTGTYTVKSYNVLNGGFGYKGAPESQSATVKAGETDTATVSYTVISGRLAINVSGLPTGTNASLTVTGPFDYSQTVGNNDTLNNLSPGVYKIASANVTQSGKTFIPNQALQSISISAGAVGNANIVYTENSGVPGANLTVEGAYITQAIQRFDGSVPLVEGREALLRVFVTADAPNTLQPAVRVRLFNGLTLVRSFTIAAPDVAVPSSVNESLMNRSWNATLTETDMQPGLRIQVDVDPNNLITESDESDNVWPRTGSSEIVVRSVAPFNIRFVPVHQSVNDLTGNITSSNMESFLAMTRDVWPVKEINASIREPYTSSAPALQADNTNGAWNTVLTEIRALRLIEGSSSNYFGVVATSYSSGIAGLGYVPGRDAIGWDKSGSRSWVTAHELGHNFNRLHVGACVSGDLDGSYPHPGGIIAHYGWIRRTNTIVANTITDLMGYCSSNWISDFNWTKVMDYRGAAPAYAAAMQTGEQPVLLVWGQVRNGNIVLEPTMQFNGQASIPTQSGPYRLELRDENNRVVSGFSFTPDAIDHDNSSSAFAFTIPLPANIQNRVQSIAVIGPASSAIEQITPAALAAVSGATQPAPSLIRNGSQATLNWDKNLWNVAIVKNSNNGNVLAILREPGHSFHADQTANITVNFSNGTRSLTQEFGSGR